MLPPRHRELPTTKPHHHVKISRKALSSPPQGHGVSHEGQVVNDCAVGRADSIASADEHTPLTYASAATPSRSSHLMWLLLMKGSTSSTDCEAAEVSRASNGGHGGIEGAQ